MNKPKVLPKYASQVLADAGTFYSLRLPVSRWIAVEDHPRQRDTQRQARKPHWDCARQAHGPVLDALRLVIAGELNGKLVKVDGHTRAFLWACGELPEPEYVVATVYRCTTAQELDELYDVFDSVSASKGKPEGLTGAYRKHGLRLTSQRLKPGYIADALTIALSGKQDSDAQAAGDKEEINLDEGVKYFAPELKLLDSANPRSETYYSGVVAGALLVLALAPELIEFFKALSTRSNPAPATGPLDPVDALLARIAQLRGRGPREMKEFNGELAGQTLRAAFAWKSGPQATEYWFSEGIEPMDLSSTVLKVKAVKAAAPSVVDA